MRLVRRASLAVLALASLATSAQVSWTAGLSAQSTTLVDVLNGDEDYTLLLTLLQRAKLIPTLNKLNGSTFFAPTNDAIKRQTGDLWYTAFDGRSASLSDNVQEELRQQLFYHLLNYYVANLPEDHNVKLLNSLHYPNPYTEPPTKEPPPYPPWMPPKQSTLGNEPQRLRLTTRNGVAWVGVDAFGEGGVEVVKEKVNATNGVVYKISDMLKVPRDLGRIVANQPSLSYFNKLRTPEIDSILNSTSDITLFMPVDAAWNGLDELERLYLESEFAADDWRRILDMHTTVKKGVKWTDTLKSGTNLTTVYGSDLEIAISTEKIQISDARIIQPDILASNGVLHLVDSLLVPPGALQLTPEKYLLALNCTSFVSLLHSVNLTHLVNDTNAEYTILAPKDDVLSFFADTGIPKPGSNELRKWLEYHFIPGKWTSKKLNDGALLETVLREKGLDDGRQVLQVEVSEDEKQDVSSRHIRFGGASVIGEPKEISNSLLYFVSRPLEPPVDPLQAALPSLDLSSFLAAIFSTSLADAIKKQPRTTFLIPHNSAFKRLGLLVSDHLLAASSKSDLENVILHHIIDSVEYSQSLVNNSQRTFATLEGSDLQLERLGNSTIFVSASGGWAGMRSFLYPKNLLTETGVIHELSDIVIPRSVELNVGKLMKAAKGTTMISMMARAGFDWILNGTAPPDGSQWAEEGLGGAGWTVLCPTDDAFKKFNLTQLFESTDVLRANVRQHLIPTPPSPTPSGSMDVSDVLNNNRPLALEQLGSYSTLLSPSSAYGDIVFRELEDKSAAGYMVGIKNARGTDGKTDWGRVLSWGRTTTGSGTGGVIQIDRLLIPYYPPWWIEYGAPSVVGIGGVVMICFFFYGVRKIWNRDTTEATYEPVGGFGPDDDS